MPKPISRIAQSVQQKIAKPRDRTLMIALAVFGLVALLGLFCLCRSEAPKLVIANKPAFSDHDALLKKIHTAPHDVLKVDNYGAYPLHKAILANDVEQLEVICKSSDCKKWLMQKDRYGVTPLFYLIVHPKRAEMQEAFLKLAVQSFTDWEACKAQKLPDGKSPFHVLSDYDIGALPNLFNHNIQITEQMWENFFAEWTYQCPLHYAAKQDDVRVIKWLAKANYPMLKEHNSKTALQYAIDRGCDSTAYFIAIYKGAKKGDRTLAKNKNLYMTQYALGAKLD